MRSGRRSGRRGRRGRTFEYGIRRTPPFHAMSSQLALMGPSLPVLSRQLSCWHGIGSTALVPSCEHREPSSSPSPFRLSTGQSQPRTFCFVSRKDLAPPVQAISRSEQANVVSAGQCPSLAASLVSQSVHFQTCLKNLTISTFLVCISSIQGCSSIRQGVARRSVFFSRLGCKVLVGGRHERP